MKNSIAKLLFIACLLFSSLVQAEEYYPLDEAQRLLNLGDPVAAYDILAPLEGQFSGDLRFDFLYGVAALQSGHPNLAILPLMRVVLQQPDNLVARYYLARAYLEVNDLQTAEQEYRLLLGRGVTGVLRQRVEADLEQIQAMQNQSETGVMETALVVGFDSNANSATNVNNFLGYVLSDESKQTASLMLAGSVGWDYKQRSRKWGSFNQGLVMRQEIYPQASFVNNTSFSIYGSWTPGRQNNSEGRHTFDGIYQVVLVDGRLNTQGSYITYENRGPGSKSSFTYYLRYGQQVYEPAFGIKDISQLSLGLSKKRIKDDNRVGVTAVIVGWDLAHQAGSPYNKVFGGVRYSTERYGKQLLSYSSIGYLYSDYSGLFLGTPRTDHQFDMRFGLLTRPYGNWRPVVELRIVDTISTVALYDYTRYSLTVTLKQKQKQ